MSAVARSQAPCFAEASPCCLRLSYARGSDRARECVNLLCVQLQRSEDEGGLRRAWKRAGTSNKKSCQPPKQFKM
ncbi:hypothetical protein CBOM_07777 [Ceraceosorus bombacis]|uniref:Uncharacterized protein n=1 Tax=Ceraceosorus bombacis TaxID=401625 RepID=A0A0P1BPQ8_9BASI|nr:hypothetical protein CBOM_07777 [Ceraceosorus bombacis]